MAVKYKCKTSYCLVYLSERGYCPTHKRDKVEEKRTKDSLYDQRNRDKDMKRFYASSDWQKARLAQLATHPLCNKCKREVANTVHHTTPAKTLDRNERLSPIHLESLCHSCHSKHEAMRSKDVYEYKDLFTEESNG